MPMAAASATMPPSASCRGRAEEGMNSGYLV
jgi:hypothetical protein